MSNTCVPIPHPITPPTYLRCNIFTYSFTKPKFPSFNPSHSVAAVLFFVVVYFVKLRGTHHWTLDLEPINRGYFFFCYIPGIAILQPITIPAINRPWVMKSQPHSCEVCSPVSPKFSSAVAYCCGANVWTMQRNIHTSDRWDTIYFEVDLLDPSLPLWDVEQDLYT